MSLLLLRIYLVTSCGRIESVEVLDKSQRQSFEWEGDNIIIVAVIKSGKAPRAADGTFEGFQLTATFVYRVSGVLARSGACAGWRLHVQKPEDDITCPVPSLPTLLL